MKQIWFFIIGLILAQHAMAQGYFVKKHLQSDWQVFEAGKYRGFLETDKVKSIYIPLEALRYKGDKLMVESDGEFSLFVNDQLFIDQTKSLMMSMDSFPAKAIMLSIYRNDGISPQSFKTVIATQISVPALNEPILRKGNDARNFVIAAGLLLIVFFVFILRLNPKLTFHYFSLSKLFSLRESDENQMFARIASSANVLFYLFASLLVGLAIMGMVIGLTPEYKFQHFLSAQSFIEISVRWLLVSGIVLLTFLCKAVVIYFFSILYNMGDQSGFQFLGFIRSALLIAVLLTAFTTTFFIMNGTHEGWYSFLYESLRWIMVGWIVLIFLKLIRRVPFSAFHLFSYICATELIPFLVAVKVLYE